MFVSLGGVPKNVIQEAPKVYIKNSTYKLAIQQWFLQHLSHLLPHNECSFTNTVYKEEAYRLVELNFLGNTTESEQFLIPLWLKKKNTKKNMKAGNSSPSVWVLELNDFYCLSLSGIVAWKLYVWEKRTRFTVQMKSEWMCL